MPKEIITKIIYVVIPGDKMFNIPNPALTSQGKNRTELMKTAGVLPANPSLVLCGTGKRHDQTAEILGLKVDFYNPLCGTSDVLEGAPDNLKMLAGSGRYPVAKWQMPDTRSFLSDLGDKTIIIADQIFLIGAGYPICPSGSILKINCQGGRYIKPDLIFPVS